MKLIIPMAGRGSRLRPQSSVTPKPLLSVRGQCMVERIIAGFSDTLPRPITDCVFILGPSFEREVRPLLKEICQRQKTCPHFVVQHEALGTGHAVSVANDYLSGEGIVVYADTVFDMGDSPNIDDCDVLVWVKHVEDPRRFGVAVRDGERVVAFVEKPQELISNEALIGIYYVKDLTQLKSSIDYLFENSIRGKGGEYYLTDAFDHMLRGGGLFKTAAVRHWLDCGTLEALMDTTQHLLNNEPSQYSSEAVQRSIIIPPVYIGEGATISDSVVGPYVCVENGATITRSVVSDSILYESSSVSNAVVSNSFVGASATLSPTPMTVNVGDYSELQ